MGRLEFFRKARDRSPGLTTEQLYAAYETYLTCPLSPFREERGLPAADCCRCGRCCRRPWRVEVQLSDVLRWAGEGRHDILGSLERRPRKHGSPPASDLVLVQFAGLLAGAGEDELATALSVASGGEGSYVIPHKGSCSYLIDGDAASCGIYETRPAVCRLFPNFF